MKKRDNHNVCYNCDCNKSMFGRVGGWWMLLFVISVCWFCKFFQSCFFNFFFKICVLHLWRKDMRGMVGRARRLFCNNIFLWFYFLLTLSLLRDFTTRLVYFVYHLGVGTKIVMIISTLIIQKQTHIHNIQPHKQKSISISLEWQIIVSNDYSHLKLGHTFKNSKLYRRL